MKKYLFLLFATSLLFSSCGDDAANLPPTEVVMAKFENKTGKDIEGLVVSRANIGTLGKGKTSEYFEFNELGQQFGYALVEAVGTVDGKRFYTASACQGVCGTDSAPHGTWLEPDYYKITVHIAVEEGNYLEFRLAN